MLPQNPEDTQAKRYILTRPIKGGTQWFDIRDTSDPNDPNFAVVSVSATLQDAEAMAEKHLDYLNWRNQHPGILQILGRPNVCKFCGSPETETTKCRYAPGASGVHEYIPHP